MESKKNTFACIDVGGTAIKYGRLDADGKVLEKFETPTEAYKGGPELALKVKTLAEKIKEIDPNIKGIAISTAGVVDPNKAQIVYANEFIPHYIGVDYKDILSPLGVPVEAENDVNSAGLAEGIDGAGQEFDSLVCLTIGTGIGGCFLNHKELLHGASFSACEIGYLPIDGKDFQDQASTTALVKDVAQRKGEDPKEWNGRKIFDLAEQGDEDCLAAIERISDILGKGMAFISYVLNPEAFILGGGIMAREDILRPLIQRSFNEHALPLAAAKTKIRFAKNQNDAGMKGALFHFLQKHPDLK